MKTKIKINLETMPEIGQIVSDSTLQGLLKAITREQGESLTAGDVIGFLTVNKAIYYPSINKYAMRYEEPTLHISADDGKTFPLSLTWSEIFELAPDTNPDDLRHLDYTPEAVSDSEADLLMQEKLS